MSITKYYIEYTVDGIKYKIEDNIYYDKNNGRLGINTNVLDSTFNVSGNTQISSLSGNTGEYGQVMVDDNGLLIRGGNYGFSLVVDLKFITDTPLPSGTTIYIPNGWTYNLKTGDYQFLYVYLDGCLLMVDSTTSSYDYDYSEISDNEVRFNNAIPSDCIIQFLIFGSPNQPT